MDRTLLFSPPTADDGVLVCTAPDGLVLGDGRGTQASFQRGDVLPEEAFDWPGILGLICLGRLTLERYSQADRDAKSARDRMAAEVARLEAQRDRLVSQIEAGERCLTALRVPLRGATAAAEAIEAWRAFGGAEGES